MLPGFVHLSNPYDLTVNPFGAYTFWDTTPEMVSPLKKYYLGKKNPMNEIETETKSIICWFIVLIAHSHGGIVLWSCPLFSRVHVTRKPIQFQSIETRETGFCPK